MMGVNISKSDVSGATPSEIGFGGASTNRNEAHAALAWSCGPIAFFWFFAGAMVVAVEGQKFIHSNPYWVNVNGTFSSVLTTSTLIFYHHHCQQSFTTTTNG